VIMRRGAQNGIVHAKLLQVARYPRLRRTGSPSSPPRPGPGGPKQTSTLTVSDRASDKTRGGRRPRFAVYRSTAVDILPDR